MARRLSHEMSCSLSPGLAGQWTGVDIIKSETRLLIPIEALQIPPESKPSSQIYFQTRTWHIVPVLKFSFDRDNGKTPPP